MGYRINERNAGHWTLDGEPKTRGTKHKKVSRSFTLKEIEMFQYLIEEINKNIYLDVSDRENQVYRDRGNIKIEFSRDDVREFRSLLDKFSK